MRRFRVLATRLFAVLALGLATRHLRFILLLFLLEPFLRPRLDLRLRFGQRLQSCFASCDLRRYIHPVRHTVAVGVLGHPHQLLHFFMQLRFDPADVPVRQRAVPARIRLHLGAIQRNAAQLDQLHLLRDQQHLHEQLLYLARKPLAKGGQRVMVRMRVRRNVAERHRVIGRSLNLAAREHARRIPVHQQTQQHLGMMRRHATSRICAAQFREVHLRDDFHHEPRQMVFR